MQLAIPTVSAAASAKKLISFMIIEFGFVMPQSYNKNHIHVIKKMNFINFAAMTQEETYFIKDEKATMLRLVRKLSRLTCDVAEPDDFHRLKNVIKGGIAQGYYRRDRHGINPVVRHFTTAVSLCVHIAADRSMIVATLL